MKDDGFMEAYESAMAFAEDALVERMAFQSAASITIGGRSTMRLSDLVARAGDWRGYQDEVTCLGCGEWTRDFDFVADDVPVCVGCQLDLVMDGVGVMCSGCSSAEGDRAEWDQGVFLCRSCVAKVVAAETGGEVVSR